MGLLFKKKKEPAKTPQKSKLDIRIKELQKRNSLENELFERNQAAMSAERAGDISGAIKGYESVIAEGFDGSAAFRNLAGIYRTQGRTDDEIRILSKYLDIASKRGWNTPKVDKFRKDLESAMKRK